MVYLLPFFSLFSFFSFHSCAAAAAAIAAASRFAARKVPMQHAPELFRQAFPDLLQVRFGERFPIRTSFFVA